jgi:type VI secretion system secreted protein VgrG
VFRPNETDLDFLARLAAEEGLLYAFTHDDKNHTLVHVDRVQSLGNIDGDAVVYEPMPGGDQAKPGLRQFRYTEQVRTAQQTQRDYTFKNPRYGQEHNVEGRELDHQNDGYERYDYPGRYKQDAAGKPFTKIRLQALRHDARVAYIEGDDARIEPGKEFELTGHPGEDWNTRWRAVRITHQGYQASSQHEDAAGGEQGASYSQQAEVIPAFAEWKAPLCAKPRIDGPQMATVTGPEGEEIHCDHWGRITRCNSRGTAKAPTTSTVLVGYGWRRTGRARRGATWRCRASARK